MFRSFDCGEKSKFLAINYSYDNEVNYISDQQQSLRR